MAHHGRGRINSTRTFRMHPRRDKIKLLNRQGEELAVVGDAPWGNVSHQDANAIATLQNESRTWHLPVIQCGEFRPVTGNRIRSLTDNTLWEILTVPRVTNSMHQCVCTRMNEHDSEVP